MSAKKIAITETMENVMPDRRGWPSTQFLLLAAAIFVFLEALWLQWRAFPEVKSVCGCCAARSQIVTMADRIMDVHIVHIVTSGDYINQITSERAISCGCLDMTLPCQKEEACCPVAMPWTLCP